ncbi:class F sortase [Sciscionella marina]|uniref:class F sortase n=1 Tax=Sciscionella marina TaxID=508770 RepID=UPI00037595CB|nr:class F sortase [Sciscionella marina]
MREPSKRQGSRLGAGLAASGVAVAGVGIVVAGVVLGASGNVVPGHAMAAAHASGAGYEHQAKGADKEPKTQVSPAAKEEPEPDKPRPPRATGKPKPPPGQSPGTIRLPKGGTAKLVRSEVTANRTLPIPNGVREATWWGSGLDAKQGATLFAGHVNWAGQTGPFNELWNDKTGDVVTVKDTAGTEYRYRIGKVVTLHKNALPDQAEQLFGQSGPHRIVLVTCGGRWVGGDEGYASNRIMVANPM